MGITHSTHPSIVIEDCISTDMCVKECISQTDRQKRFAVCTWRSHWKCRRACLSDCACLQSFICTSSVIRTRTWHAHTLLARAYSSCHNWTRPTRYNGYANPIKTRSSCRWCGRRDTEWHVGDFLYDDYHNRMVLWFMRHNHASICASGRQKNLSRVQPQAVQFKFSGSTFVLFTTLHLRNLRCQKHELNTTDIVILKGYICNALIFKLVILTW